MAWNIFEKNILQKRPSTFIFIKFTIKSWKVLKVDYLQTQGPSKLIFVIKWWDEVPNEGADKFYIHIRSLIEEVLE